MLDGAGIAYAPPAGYSRGIAVCADVLYGFEFTRDQTVQKGQQVAHRLAIVALEAAPQRGAPHTTVRAQRATLGYHLTKKTGPEGAAQRPDNP